jgi:hypothetical protein
MSCGASAYHHPNSNSTNQQSVVRSTSVEEEGREGLHRSYVVGEGTLDGVQVVRADGHERAAAADVLVQLVLQVNEAARVSVSAGVDPH